MAARRGFAVSVALVLAAGLLAACGTGGQNDAAEGTSSFCGAWADLQSFLDAEQLPDEQLVGAYLTDRAAAVDSVPDVLRDDWDALVAFDDVFIEVLYSVDFDATAIAEPVVIQAFGSIEQAEAAERRHDEAVDTIDRWSTANCREAAPSRFAFCQGWRDIQQWLAREQDERRDVSAEEAADALAGAVAEADAARPADVPDEWDAFARYFLTRHDLLVTVGFDEELISDELLTDAFGSVSAARDAEAAAAAAVDVIEEWTVTGCGDFCVRGNDIREALGRLGSLGQDRDVLQESWRRNRLLSDLELGDRLVPDELRPAWEDAVAEVRGWVAFWAAYDFDPDLRDREDAVAAAVERVRSGDPTRYFDDLSPEDRVVLEAWSAGGELTAELEQAVRQAAFTPPTGRPGFNEIFLAIDDWVEDNCAGAGSPGIIEVELPRISGGAGGVFAVVLGEVGSSVDDLVDARRFDRGACRPISRSPFGVEDRGDGSTEPMRWRLAGRPGEQSDNPHLCEGWEDERPIEPGTYGLVVAQYPGLVAGSREAAARPGRCLTLEVEVAGDTLVQLPELPLCDVELPENQEWLRTEPVDGSLPGAGTLSIRFPEDRAPATVGDGDVPQREIMVVALPAGTTLNEIGREQVPPSGAACVLFSDGRRDPELPSRPVVLPLAPLAPGFLPGCVDALWLSGNDPAPGQRRGEPPPPEELSAILLAPGAYDIRLEAMGNEEVAQPSCATVRDVIVDGDTVVDAPTLEACP